LLEPKRWRPLRTRLSPTFTSGKLKEMFSMIIECSNTFEKYVDSLIANGNNIDVREVCARFTTDVISSCAFGLDTNAMSGENNKFREIGKTFFNMSLVQRIKIQLREGLPTLYTLLGYILPRDDMTQFFTKVVNDVIDYRRKNNVVRQDFIHTLMDLQDHPEKLSINLTNDLLIAQAFVFFVAGFETSASTIANALYELAQNQDIQDKLREEITEHHDMNNGEWLYESIKKMPILDVVLK
ncbi:probable cytochrome P450 6a21, partial [Ceratina calcarata]|uniref:Probable cytochrome P450 6a21 n=1 Tax=Ceratina calcarata TaxID=156304 RepID=A0AAJ7J421_9HYME